MRKNLIITTVISAFFIFLLMACNSQEDTSINLPVKYLALGDSYTIGQGVDEQQRWPNQLSEKLRENGYEITETAFIAKTGWKTGDLLNALADTTLENFNLVSICIGVNNLFWGQPFEIYEAEFDSLLNLSIQLAGKESVFVMSLPDYGVTPLGSANSESIAQKVDLYNDYILQRCTSQNIPFIDITSISRELGDSEGALSSDNLHPSDGQYAKWVEAALPTVLEMLEK